MHQMGIPAMRNCEVQKVIGEIIRIFLSKFGVSNSESLNEQNLQINPIDHNSLEGMNKFYSNLKVVEKYVDSERIAFYNSVINLLIDKGIEIEHKNIVDIGCGTGHLLKLIGENFETSNLLGLEYSNSAIEIAKKIYPKATFCQFDIYKEYPQKFDVLLCTEVLEHLLYPNKALEACLQMIASEGTLLITVPDGRKDTYLGHINFWSPESWKIFIEANCKEFQLDIGIIKKNVNYAIIKKTC